MPKAGRPKELKDAKRVLVVLERAQLERLEKLGGSRSAHIRTAIDAYYEERLKKKEER